MAWRQFGSLSATHVELGIGEIGVKDAMEELGMVLARAYLGLGQ